MSFDTKLENILTIVIRFQFVAFCFQESFRDGGIIDAVRTEEVLCH